MKLVSDWSRIEEIIGCSLRDHFLMPVRTLDNPKSCTPVILEKDAWRWMLLPGIEKGNVESLTLPPDVTPVYMQRYFTFDDIDAAAMPRNLVEAVKGLAGNETKLTIDAQLPVALEMQLAQSFSISVEDGVDAGAVRVREISTRAIASRLAAGRADAVLVAKRLLERNPNRARLATYLDSGSDVHFKKLDHILRECGFSAVIVTSRLNVQEIAGVPLLAHRRPFAALYIPGLETTYLLEPADRGEGQRYSSVEAAISDLLPKGRIGVETEDMGAALFRALGLQDREHAPADVPIRRWRDETAYGDLAYYIIAARTSAHAIDNALSYASGAVRQGKMISEMDVDRVYYQGLHDHVRSTGLPLRVTRYMTNLHSGTRTLYPANPASYLISADVRTLKIDSGCLIYDKEGYLLGVSDIARTLSFTDEGQEIYPLIVDGVRRHLIPAARAGAVAEDVFRVGIEAIWGRRHELKSSRLTPELVLADVYKRDVGHLLGKNDLSHLRYIAGDRGVLSEGMVSCLEYQWPIDGHALAYEDTCMITPDGGLNFTSDAE